MPNWKKVIVSGSNAVLNNITASGDISSSGEIHASSFLASGNITTHTISTVESSPIGSDGATVVDTFQTSAYDGAIYDYTLKDTGVGARTGQFMVSHDDGSITFTDTSTKHLTDLVIPEITADIDDGDVRIKIAKGQGYTFKS